MPLQQESDNIAERKRSTGSSSTEHSSVALRTAKRAADVALAHIDFFVMLLLMILLRRYCLLLPPPIPIENINFFDTSWGVDLVAKAQQGVWLGTNAIFTYGPLFQKVLSWAPLRNGMSLATFYLYLWVFQYWTIVIGIYVTGALLLRRQPAWLRAFYLLLLTIFWIPINWILFDIKLLLPLCCFAIFLRMLPTQVAHLGVLPGVGESLPPLSLLLF